MSEGLADLSAVMRLRLRGFLPGIRQAHPSGPYVEREEGRGGL